MDSPPPNDYLTGVWIAVLAAAVIAELAMVTLKFWL